MLACTALVGCTNEDVVNNEQENQNGSNAYMAVRLVMADSNNSRAAEDGGYNEGLDDETGDPGEQKIDGTKSIFLFYDESGKYVTSGQLLTQTDFEDGHEGTHHSPTDINDLKGEAYVVLSSPTEAIKNTIRQVLTVVNYSAVNDLKYKTKEQALATIVEAEKDPANAGFVMSTSVYHDGTNVVNTTSILGKEKDAQGNFLPLIFETQEEAKKSPVVIHIERASAKVQLTYTNDNTKTAITTTDVSFEVEGSEAEDKEGTEKEEDKNDEAGGQEGNDITIDGIQYPVRITINGWTVNNVNKTSYLVKSVDETTWNSKNPLLYDISWNNANDYRSYWAVGTKYEIDESENNGLVAYTYNQAVNATYTNSAMYCYEQTTKTPTRTTALKGIQYPNITTVLIAATIETGSKAEGATATTWTPVGNLYEYGGIYYTETGLKNLILKNMSTQYYTMGTKEVETKTEEGTTTTETVDAYFELGENDLDIKTNGTLAGVTITVKEKASEDATSDIQYYTKETTKDDAGNETTTYSPASQDDINEAISDTGYTNVQGYEGGKCYYQIPIEHLSSQQDADKTYLYGVVRNHWYKLNISKVIRIGEPVYNPGVEIPEIPKHDKNYYMAAELHVLNWHVVEQDVTLD